MDTEQLVRELNLKAMTAISNLLSDYERGLISKAQVSSGCRAVFDTVGGLVSADTFEFVSLAANEFKGAKGVELQVTRYDNQLKGVARICGTGALLGIYAARPIKTPVYNEEEPDRAARDAADRYMQGLKR